MRLEIPERTNPNCHVFKIGFTYPVCIWSKSNYDLAVKTLTRTALGDPSREHYYAGSVWHRRPLVRSLYKDKKVEDLRWYAGQRRWRERDNPKTDFWLVFKTERDRTMAMMLLS